MELVDGGGPGGHRRPGVHLLQGMHPLEGDTHVGAQGQPSNGQRCKTVYTDVDSRWALITLHQKTSGFIEVTADCNAGVWAGPQAPNNTDMIACALHSLPFVDPGLELILGGVSFGFLVRENRISVAVEPFGFRFLGGASFLGNGALSN